MPLIRAGLACLVSFLLLVGLSACGVEQAAEDEYVIGLSAILEEQADAAERIYPPASPAPPDAAQAAALVAASKRSIEDLRSLDVPPDYSRAHGRLVDASEDAHDSYASMLAAARADDLEAYEVAAQKQTGAQHRINLALLSIEAG